MCCPSTSASVMIIILLYLNFSRLKCSPTAVPTAVIRFEISSDDKTFVGQLLKKVQREALTIMGAMDPSLWTAAPRLLQWTEQLGNAITMILKLEKYKTKPGLKGVASLKRMLTPRMISMWLPQDTDKRKPRGMK